MDTIVCGRGWLNKASDAGTGRGVVGISNHKGTKTQTFSICVFGAFMVKQPLEVQLQPKLELP